MSIKLSGIKPGIIYWSADLANAKPDWPYTDPEEKAKIIEDKTGIKVILGTHNYY